MIKNSVKQMFRAPWRFILGVTLLSLAAAFVCTSFGIWMSSRYSLREADSAFTTVAIPNSKALEARTDDHTELKLNYALEEASKSSHTKQMDIRPAMRGVSDALVPISAIDDGSGEIKYTLDTWTLISDQCVFSVTCESVDEISSGITHYKALLRVEEALAVHPDHPEVPKKLEIQFAMVFKPGGELPLEIGKRYLVWGTINKLTITDDKDATGFTLIEDTRDLQEDIDGRCIINEETHFLPIVQIQGDTESFLASEEGREWNDIIRASNHSVEVMATGNLNSVVRFNQEQTQIIEGRAFEQEDHNNGEKVCILSSELARYNGIKVGDEIPLKLTKTFYYQLSAGIDSGEFHQLAPYHSKDGIQEEYNYKVIGIYLSQGWTPGNFQFSPNTVFIPKSSIKENYLDERKYILMMPNQYSVILKNGSIDAFEAEMDKAGYGGMFQYYDQGYSNVAGTLSALSKNAIIMLAAGGCAWAAVLGLFLILYMSHQQRNIGIMISLGSGRKLAFVHAMTGIVITAALASLLGSVMGYFAYNAAVEAAYESAAEYGGRSVEFSGLITSGISNADEFRLLKAPSTVFVAGAAGLVLSVLLGAVFAAVRIKRSIIAIMSRGTEL